MSEIAAPAVRARQPRIRQLGLSEVVPPSAIDDEREEEKNGDDCKE